MEGACRPQSEDDVKLGTATSGFESGSHQTALFSDSKQAWTNDVEHDCRHCEEAIEEIEISEVVGTSKRWVHLDDSGYFPRGRILCQMLPDSKRARPR